MSLRYALENDSDFSTTELVGVVMSAERAGYITVVDRRGNAHEISLDSIEALKVFPP